MSTPTNTAPVCNHILRGQGQPYPRTCGKCGLGPCNAHNPTSFPSVEAQPNRADVDNLLALLRTMAQGCDKPELALAWASAAVERLASAARVEAQPPSGYVQKAMELADDYARAWQHDVDGSYVIKNQAPKRKEALRLRLESAFPKKAEASPAEEGRDARAIESAVRSQYEADLRQAREALVIAHSQMAHKLQCFTVRPTTEWNEHGSVSFGGCSCEIKAVRAALAALDARLGEQRETAVSPAADPQRNEGGA